MGMPELAEVEFMRRNWEPAMDGLVVAVEANYRKNVFGETASGDIEGKLVGRELVKSMRHGKQMCFLFLGDVWLGIHLGMTGMLKYFPVVRESEGRISVQPMGHKYEKVTEWTGARDEMRHCRLKIETTKGTLTFHDARLFGRVRIHHGANMPDWWKAHIPEPHDERFTEGYLRMILQRHGRMPIKSLLLEQDYFPGIGNWMADEVLWRARIHPAEKAAKLVGTDREGALKKMLKEVCEDALRVIAPDWGTPPDSWLFNHRWEDGGKCPVSGETLVREKIGGRTTCYSPELQKLRS